MIEKSIAGADEDRKTATGLPELMVDEKIFDEESAESSSSMGAGDRGVQGTKRGLSARHIQMIALGGCIGTGLFLTSGQNIYSAGPAGALIAYCVVGCMVYCVMTCLGEMSTLIPVSGSFNHFASRFVDPALGFALGWNYWFSAVTLATELSAAATIIDWWKPVMPSAAWCSIFLVLLLSINLVGVRLYGELEYWFALIKILTVIVFIIIGILVSSGALGGEVIGFKYWSDPGAFNNGGVGFLSVLLTAGFSFQGTEIVGISAGEAKNPIRTIPRAIRNTFWRIIFFYISTVFLLGVCLPGNDPKLANTDDSAGTASFTLVFEKAGIHVGAHIINAIVLTSVLSAGNSAIYTCSRTLLGLSHDGNAPAILARTNRYGAPYYAVLLSSVVGFGCVFVSIYSASAAFNWFLSITSITGFISWWGIAVVHIRFRRAYRHQGRDLKDLPYKAFFFPFCSIYAILICTFIIFGQGYEAFTPTFDATLFVTDYIGLVPAIVCYVTYKLVRRTRTVPLDEVDFETGLASHDDGQDFEDEENRSWVKRVFSWIV
ncbi:amino acid permease/ SLC12A domain-containing protein [Dichotomocladium elegans]|nr:amino acid permease/ SLC12A domain-containing protein [Dichotomocladium elegans]